MDGVDGMAYTIEGSLQIPLDEFWDFLSQYLPSNSANTVFGKPVVNVDNGTLDIGFASDTDENPRTWLEKPLCLREDLGES